MTIRRPVKYPLSQEVGILCGRNSEAYRRAYALEQWAVRHGYKGHKKHIVPTKHDRSKQQSLILMDFEQ